MSVLSETLFERLLSGKPCALTKEAFAPAQEVVDRCFRLLPGLNTATSLAAAREQLSAITQKPVDESVTLFPPFHTNFGKHIFLGKDITINHGCTFLDLGGIYIEDGVLIAPKVNLLTEGHPLDPKTRRTVLLPSRIVVKQGAWIGAASTVLPGVTIGRNAVVAAGSVVNKNVDDNTIVAGVPAKVVKRLPGDESKL